MTEDKYRDEQALVLRDQERTFVDIAHSLNVDGGRSAHAAFIRALRRHPLAERAQMRSREMMRLDAFNTRLRGRDDLSVEEIARRLRGLKHDRKILFEA